MTKWLVSKNNIFDRMAKTDDMKNALVALSSDYVAVSVTDSEYSSVMSEEKIPTFDGNTVTFSDNQVMGYRPSDLDDSVIGPYTLDTAKKEINDYISLIKTNLPIENKNAVISPADIDNISSELDAIDVDLLSSIPTTNTFKWILSQNGVTQFHLKEIF
tara:strand:- start:286 stop:762 length:477 start_codon:yes stop_codon:yes gene_type:complete